MPLMAHLECIRCRHQVSMQMPPAVAIPPSVCPVDGGTLLVRYDMQALRIWARREKSAELAARPGHSLGMWRYAEVLPEVTPISLGEGWTPLLQSRRHARLLIKDEGFNPTGTAEARGVAMAVSLAVGSAGGPQERRPLAALSVATAAYAAAAGRKAHLFLPRDLSPENELHAVLYGAQAHLVDGPREQCQRQLEQEMNVRRTARDGMKELWIDLSAPLHPFRVEGDKTLGYELVEQMGWTYPDALLWPAGDAISLIGVWKAFEEMEALGWVVGRRPRVYVGEIAAGRFAAELDSGSLEIVVASGGKVVKQDERKMLAALSDFARRDGVFLSPQGAATAAAFELLAGNREIRSDERSVLVNPSAAWRDDDALRAASPLLRLGRLPTSLPVGGIITPV